MALTPQARVSQATLTALTDGEAGRLDVSQAHVVALGAYPAEQAQVSQAYIQALTGGGTPAVEISQAYVVVLASGRVDDPRILVWVFTLDDHDMYVIRLGNTETLVFDDFSGQWYTWGSGESALWRAYTGANWPGGRALAGSYSNVVCGDDANGSLYFLDPEGEEDDDAIFEGVRRSFTRVVTAQYIMPNGYDDQPCYGLEVYGSAGQTTESASVELKISDDRGISFESYGSVEVESGDYSARLNWPSLGGMSAPGRLFQLIHTGALRRIDHIEMEGGDGN